MSESKFVLYDDYEYLYLDKYGCGTDLEYAAVRSEAFAKSEVRFIHSSQSFIEVEVSESGYPTKHKDGGKVFKP